MPFFLPNDYTRFLAPLVKARGFGMIYFKVGRKPISTVATATPAEVIFGTVPKVM